VVHAHEALPSSSGGVGRLMWGRNKEGWLCESIVWANSWLDLRAQIAIGNEEREAGCWTKATTYWRRRNTKFFLDSRDDVHVVRCMPTMEAFILVITGY
jgi:hypothetical protein